jgi:ubiquinone/menaquinone biosynthesis C-methylase UbiE
MKYIKPQDLKTHIPPEYLNYASFGPYRIPVFGKVYFGRIKEILKIFSNLKEKFDKVLDIGGGMGLFSLNYKINFPNSKISILDKIKICEIQEIITSKRKYGVEECIEGDIEKETPYTNETFDLIFALDILEHVNDPSIALDEILRILKKKSLLFISVPIEGWILRLARMVLGKVKNIQINPHWNGKIKSEKEFNKCLRYKNVKILLEKNYPFRTLPRAFSYDVFYLVQKL